MWETIKEIWQVIMSNYNDFYGRRGYFVLLLAAAGGLFVICRRDRRIIYPSLILLLIIFNPVLYRYVFHKIIFWRLFWMLPEVILIALAATRIVMKAEKKHEKVLALVICSLIIMLSGMNVHNHNGFVRTTNKEKVPAYVKRVCDIILEQDENPKVILPNKLFVDARIYNGNIEMMYGRDVEGYILYTTKERTAMFEQLESEYPDYSYIFPAAYEGGYNFVVTYSENPVPDEYQEIYKYYYIAETDGFSVYQLRED